VDRSSLYLVGSYQPESRNPAVIAVGRIVADDEERGLRNAHRAKSWFLSLGQRFILSIFTNLGKTVLPEGFSIGQNCSVSLRNHISRYSDDPFDK